MLESLGEWSSYTLTKPAVFVSVAALTSFTVLSLVGEKNELENSVAEDRPAARETNESLLKAAWDVLLFPDAQRADTCCFLAAFPEEEETDPIIDLFNSARAMNARDQPAGESTELHSDPLDDQENSEDDEAHAALMRKLRSYEEEVKRIQVVAARDRETMRQIVQRERELRMAAEEDREMYRDAAENFAAQLRAEKKKLHEAQVREAAYQEELQRLQKRIEHYDIEYESEYETVDESESEDFVEATDGERGQWKKSIAGIFG